MEGAFVVARKLAVEIIVVGRLLALLGTQFAERCDTATHIPHVIPVAADHIRDVQDLAGSDSLIEIHRNQVAVRMGATQADPYRIEFLQRGGPHLLQGIETRCIHRLLAPLVIRTQGRRRIAAAQETAAQTAAALDDRFRNEALGQRRSHQALDTTSTGALAHDGQVVRIAAESRDVVVNPLDRRQLVINALVSGAAVAILFGQGRMGEEAQQAEAVIDGHEDDAALCPGFPIESRIIAAAAGVCATVDPQGDRKFSRRLADRFGRRPDIQEEAVFTGRRQRLDLELFIVEGTGLTAALDRRSAEGVRHLDAFPRDDGLRGFPAEITDGRSRIRDALEDHDIRILGQDALQQTALDLDRVHRFSVTR